MVSSDSELLHLRSKSDSSSIQDNLVDDPIPNSSSISDGEIQQAKQDTLALIRNHLTASYELYPSQAFLDSILDQIPNLTPSARSAFHLFSTLIPRLAPKEPFLELCDGYATDMKFVHSPDAAARSRKIRDISFDIATHLPIKTNGDLLKYADDVAGSIASAICYLAWSILTDSPDPRFGIRPVDNLAWTQGAAETHRDVSQYRWIVDKSREMGRALQLVNIARDVAKDAIVGRVYVPLSSFPNGSASLDTLLPSTAHPPDYALYNLPLLDIADDLREASAPAMDQLPRTARGGTRAMAASYFEIAEEVRRRGGKVDDRGVKVEKWRRGLAACKAMWGLYSGTSSKGFAEAFSVHSSNF